MSINGGIDLFSKLPRDLWNHIFQYLSLADRGRFAQICKWNAYYFSPLRFMLSEQVYFQGLQQWGNIIEGILEHPLNTLAQKAGAALYIAAAKGDWICVRKLLEMRPDIRPADKEKSLSIASILEHHHIVREILIHRYPEASRCKDVHAIMNAIFPPQRENATLPHRPEVALIYDELMKTTVMEAEEDRLYSQTDFTVQSQLRDLILGYFTRPHYSTSKGNLNFTLRTMSSFHPLFAKAWAMANRNQPVEIREVKKEDAVRQGGSNVHQKGNYASYDARLHRIEVDPDSSSTHKVELLFFETMNAYQREIFQTIFDLASSGELSREEYASLIEFVEYKSGLWRTKMLNYMRGNQVPICSFTDFWEHVNKPCFPGAVAHADHYRFSWDKSKYFGRYLAKNPGMIFPQTPSTLLSLAAAEGDVSFVIDLLRKYPDLDEWEVVGGALSTAAENGHLDVVAWMCHLRGDLSAASMGIALCAAAARHHWDIVRYVLQQRPDIHSRDINFALKTSAT